MQRDRAAVAAENLERAAENQERVALGQPLKPMLWGATRPLRDPKRYVRQLLAEGRAEERAE